ncbi:hypothetical protein SEA_BACHOME_79 [Mycobacterium phage Bachome]|nr:hypothetical protein SEA_BACHOME_79 [Mycobacterium phage Bachome]
MTQIAIPKDKLDAIEEAWANFNTMANAKQEFIESSEEDADTSYRYDEVITDYNIELAYLGKALAETITELIKEVLA